MNQDCFLQAIGQSFGGYSSLSYRQALQMDSAEWARMMGNSQTAGSLGSAFDAIQWNKKQAIEPEQTASKPRVASNAEWLDRRVNELRVRL